MAGKSPGRAEQEKSSGETAKAKDPRLAVSRETKAPQGARGADEARNGKGRGGGADDAPTGSRATRQIRIPGDPGGHVKRVAPPEKERGHPVDHSDESTPNGGTDVDTSPTESTSKTSPERPSNDVATTRKPVDATRTEQAPPDAASGDSKNARPAPAPAPAPDSDADDAAAAEDASEEESEDAAAEAAEPQDGAAAEVDAEQPGDEESSAAKGDDPKGDDAKAAAESPDGDAAESGASKGDAAESSAAKDDADESGDVVSSAVSEGGAESGAREGDPEESPAVSEGGAESGVREGDAAESDGPEGDADESSAVSEVDAESGASKGDAAESSAEKDGAAGAAPAASTAKIAAAGGASPAVKAPAAKAKAKAAAAESPLEKTKQQPLPPLPGEPLKLLAELTNTPPPPETLVRTVVRRVKIWTPLVVLLAIIFCVVQAVRPLPSPKLALTSASSYTFPGAAPSVPWPSEGQAALEVKGLGSMGTYGQQKPLPIASVAKVMTAYIILRDHPITSGQGPKIAVDQQAVNDFSLGTQGESVVKVTAGEQISEFEALEDIMIASANNVARLLARWDAGSEAAFVQKMNTTAKELGMGNTTYTDPSGLDATTVSTASDQLKLAQKAMGDATFRRVVDQPNFKTASGDSYNNWNHLVGTNNVIGVKTGTSTAAGGNLVFAATKSVGGTTQLVLGVVLGQYKPSILDTVTAAGLQLVVSAQQSLTADQIIKKGDVVGYVDDGLGGRTPVVATQNVQAIGWAGNKVTVALDASPSGIPHSAKAGTTVGTLTVGGGPGQVKVPVALQSDLTAPSFGAKLTRLG
ncbi:D-alanyl-D-alanine carboxypeptidase [Streptomyces sp. RB6PN25]|uniref:D-alanyl-D-alanine carboxypeptidase n=1 Tax=Streptomyces humicola TaxID=2953240 RepID=A0ABT1PSL3_9ACTN|nr:D-alanyl-D-alanine carboxypeptidase [Streptomyces humicola]MCQ4080655.1 D-alanyl-D-alanine carboxypeptidase [Streptomyces humicola]